MTNIYYCNSEENSITFQSANNKATAFLDDNENIYINEKIEKKSFGGCSVFILLIVFSVIKSLIIIPLIENKTLSVYTYLFLAIAISLYMIIGIIKFGLQNKNNWRKNHGAEHMVWTAYKKLKRIPSIDEVKKFSRFNRHCGITIYSGFITSQLIGFFVYFFTGFVINEFILFFAAIFFRTLIPFNLIGLLMQFFTTKKPDDINIKLAISALVELIKKDDPTELLNYKHPDFEDKLSNITEILQS